MQAPENANAERQHTTGSSEKVVTIETCRECKTHRSNTWHDETKYEANFKLVQAAINALTPEVEVIRKVDGPINLGAFEIKHGEQLIYSKKNTGLWPNAKAVAQRVKTYFEDLSSGKNVSNYGKQKETAYIPKRVPGEARASTSAGFRSTKLGEKNNTQASAKTLTPAKQVKADSAGGSPGEEELEGGEDRIKGEEDHHHHADEHKSKTPEHHAEEEAHPVGAAGHHHEEHKEEHNKPASGHATPKHESAAPEPVHENKAAHEEHKEQPGSAHPHEEPKGSEPNSAVKSQEPESAAKGSEPHSATHGSEPQSAAHGSEPHSAAKGSEPHSAAEPHTAAKGSEPNSAATPKENKGDDKEYEEDFS